MDTASFAHSVYGKLDGVEEGKRDVLLIHVGDEFE
jgi:hypothetical protein